MIIIVFIWIYIFNLGIGLINLLPIKPLDGGLVFEELLSRNKKSQVIVRIVSSTMLFLLLFNIFGPIFF